MGAGQGKDDRGIDKVFNSNSFVNKITLHIDKNEELIFNPDQVQSEISVKLGGQNV